MSGPGAPAPLRPRLPVTTPRLVLRQLVAGDAADVAAYRSIPAVCRYVPFEPQGEDDVASRIEGVFARQVLEADGDAVFVGIELVHASRVIGDAMLRVLSFEQRTGEIGYVLHPDHGGHGYATEAAHALLHVAFDDLGLRRVVARVDTENADSAALAARLGMRCEAHLVENEWFKGRWADEYDFALLAREWPALHDGGVDATRWCPVAAPSAAG